MFKIVASRRRDIIYGVTRKKFNCLLPASEKMINDPEKLLLPIDIKVIHSPLQATHHERQREASPQRSSCAKSILITPLTVSGVELEGGIAPESIFKHGVNTV
jgi:hypothetical protein